MLRLQVQLHYIAQEAAHDPRGFSCNRARCFHLDSVIAEIWKPQLTQKQAAIAVRIGAHAAGAPRSKVGQLGAEPPAAIEEFRRPVALHPVFEDSDMSLVLVHLPHGYLVRAPIALGAFAIDLFRACPTLGCAKYDHRPEGAPLRTISTRIRFDSLNFSDDLIQSGGHQLVHFFRLIPLDEIRRVAVTTE